MESIRKYCIDQSLFDQRKALNNMTTPINAKKLPEYQRRKPSAKVKMMIEKIRLITAVAKTMRRIVFRFMMKSLLYPNQGLGIHLKVEYILMNYKKYPDGTHPLYSMLFTFC